LIVCHLRAMPLGCLVCDCRNYYTACCRDWEAPRPPGSTMRPKNPMRGQRGAVMNPGMRTMSAAVKDVVAKIKELDVGRGIVQKGHSGERSAVANFALPLEESGSAVRRGGSPSRTTHEIQSEIKVFEQSRIGRSTFSPIPPPSPVSRTG